MKRKVFIFILVFVFTLTPLLGITPQVKADVYDDPDQKSSQDIQDSHGQNVDSAAELKALVERFEEGGAFEGDRVAHALKIHLTAVDRFEQQDDAEKVVKHLKGFNLLLDHQQENGLVSRQAYHTLKASTDSLIKKWNAPTVKDKAVWSWFPNEDISTVEARKEMIAFAKEKGINVIYLNIGKREGVPYLNRHPEQYHAFNQLAHSNGIEVYALDGAAQWAWEEYRDIPLSRLIDVFRYNREAAKDGQFDGIQFDIEPYLLPEWDTDEREQLIYEYLQGLRIMDDIVKSYGEKHDFAFMIAMPFWFDGEEYETTYKGETKQLSDHVMDIVSGGVAIMAYRDFAEGRDSITYHSEHEMAYASKIGSKLVIGVETQYLEPYEKVSFFEEGEAYMNEQLRIVEQLYAGEPGYGGLAIHKYQSYKSMKP